MRPTLFALALIAAPAQADDWPHWLGPDRNGVSKESGWSSVGAEQPLWSTSVGLGYSCVSIVDGRLYTMGHDEEAQEDRVFCLDATTGEEHWRFAYPAETAATFHGGGTLSTPSVEGGRVYVTDREGRAFCLAAEDGSLIWENSFIEELGYAAAYYGFSASALVLDDHMILVQGGNVLALSKDDGSILWRTEDFGEGGYANPVPFTLRDRPCLAIFAGVGLVVLDGGSGEELHRYPFKGNMGGSLNAGTPIVVGQRIFISAAYGAGAALLEFDPAQPEARPLWHTRKMRNKVSGCFLWEDHLYGFDESMLKCIGLDGAERWRVRGLGMGALSICDGRLIVLSSKGELIVAEADPQEYRELSRRKVLDGGVYWTAPVLVDGRIYCRNSLGGLVCLDNRSRPPALAEAGEIIEGPIPSPADLFRRHLAAIGGAEVLRERRSLHVEGEFESASSGIVRTGMTIDRMIPNKYVRWYDLGEMGEVRHGFDGEIGWQLDPFYGDELLEGDALRELAETLHLDGDLRWKELHTELRPLGHRTFGDRPCWGLEVTSKGGATRRFYFDRETGLKVGREGSTESMVVYADYREFDGIKIPTRVTVLVAETGDEERIWVDSATWNSVDPKVFERPKGVLRMLRTPEEIETANEAAREKHGHLVGVYLANFPPFENVDAQVLIDDGGIALQLPGAPPFALEEPDDDGRWPFVGRPAMSLRFVSDEDGAVTGLVLRIVEEEHELPRREDG